MSVIKRGNSKFWYIQFQLNGSTFIKSSRTTNKRAAEQMEIDWKSKLHAQEYMGRKSQITTVDAMDLFCQSRKATPSHAWLVSCARSMARFIPKTKWLDDLTSHDLERIKVARLAEGMSPQTVKHNLSILRSSWKYAKKLGYATSDLELPQLKIAKSSLRYLTTDEERRLLEVLNPLRCGAGLRPWETRDEETRRNMQDAYDLVVLLLDTGARYSELANIPSSKVDLSERAFRLWRPKVQNESVIYMTDRVYSICARRLNDSQGPYLFSNRKGGARGYATQSIRKALRKAGLEDCKIHTLRHTHASRLIQNGLSVYEVREVLGHSDIKTTMRYAHLESKHVTSKARDVINRLNSTGPSGSGA